MSIFAQFSAPRAVFKELLVFLVSSAWNDMVGGILTASGVVIPKEVGKVLAGVGTRLNSFVIPPKFGAVNNDYNNDLKTLAIMYGVELDADSGCIKTDNSRLTNRQVFEIILNNRDKLNIEGFQNVLAGAKGHGASSVQEEAVQFTEADLQRILNSDSEFVHHQINNRTLGFQGSSGSEIFVAVGSKVVYIAVAGVSYFLPLSSGMNPFFDNLIRSAVGYFASRSLELTVGHWSDIKKGIVWAGGVVASAASNTVGFLCTPCKTGSEDSVSLLAPIERKSCVPNCGVM